MIRIELAKRAATFRPGEVLSATIHWEFDRVPKSISVFLGWRTEGKGDEDSEKVITEEIGEPAASGSRPIQITLPRGPTSLQGTLIHIRWSLGCTSKKPSESVEVPIILSMTERPVQLTRVTP